MESAYLNEESFDFDEIWYINADLELGDSHATKYDFFFKLKTVEAAILKIFLAITQQPLGRFRWNFALFFSRIL